MKTVKTRISKAMHLMENLFPDKCINYTTIGQACYTNLYINLWYIHTIRNEVRGKS